MTARIEAGKGWINHDSESALEQEIILNPAEDPKEMVLKYGTDIAVGIEALEHYTKVGMFTHLDDGTPSPEYILIKGLVEFNSRPDGPTERGGSPFGVLDSYYLKTEGAMIAFGKPGELDYLKVVHEKSPIRPVPKIGTVISQ